MPNLLHDAQQTRYGQLVTNFAQYYYGVKNIFYSETIPLITYNECSFFPR